MPKIEETNTTKLYSAQAKPGGFQPIDAAEWSDRLNAARKKRRKVLSQKVDRSDTPSGGKSESKVLSPMSSEGTVPPERDPVLAAPIRYYAGKAILVFAGTAGLGFGLVLGLGVLAGLGKPIGPGQTQQAEGFAPVATVKSAAPMLSQDVATPVTPSVSEPPVVIRAPVVEPVVAFVTPAVEEVPQPEPTGARIVAIQPDTVTVEQAKLLDIISAVDASEAFATVDDTVARPLPDEIFEPEQTTFVPNATEAKFFLHAPSGIPNWRLQRYVSELEDAGAEVSEIGREAFRVSETHLRYYSPETAAIAKEVARDMGVEARDFSDNALNGSRIEVWMAGRPKIEEEEPQPADNFFARLRARGD